MVAVGKGGEGEGGASTSTDMYCACGIQRFPPAPSARDTLDSGTNVVIAAIAVQRLSKRFRFLFLGERFGVVLAS